MNINLTNEPIGEDANGESVYLKDIWPSQEEVNQTVEQFVTRDQLRTQYANVFEGSDEWQEIDAGSGSSYTWDEKSTYVQEPPFFVDMPAQPETIKPIEGARCLVKVADSVTTDHISPAGSIPSDGPAGKYLIENGVAVSMFNSFGSRRGNDRVMTRGTFANIRVRNQLAPGTEGGYTTYFGPGKNRTYQSVGDLPYISSEEPKVGEVTSVYDASVKYQQQGVPLVALAGNDYGMGSSRDWAAKGTFLLGVKAVIAASYERIHRSNLVGMGVLPLTFEEGQNAESLGLDGTEVFDIQVDDDVKPKQVIKVKATKSDRSVIEFNTLCRIDTPVEVEYFRNGGILHTVLRKMAKS